jgi:hypothetical protein
VLSRQNAIWRVQAVFKRLFRAILEWIRRLWPPSGISFYLFDFDDNIMFLKTPLFVRNLATGDVKEVSTTDFAEIRIKLGEVGPWKDYEIYDVDGPKGTYGHFRDIPADELQPGQKQHFVEDVEKAIAGDLQEWQAPSWKLFVWACQKQRPLAIITARGHSPETIQAGVRVLVQHGLIDQEPNYLAVYPVGNAQVSAELAEEDPSVLEIEDPTSALKRIAIRKTVDQALQKHGAKPEHRFGMSDDDPKNVDLIVKAMCDCKKKYLDKRFFVIDTHEGEMVKLEVFPVDYPVTGRSKTDPEELVK